MRKENLVLANGSDENVRTRGDGKMPMNIQFFAKSSDDDDDDNPDDDDDEVDDNQDDNDDDSDDDEGNKSGKTFSQEEVTRMMSREKKQGREAVLRELGIDPKDKKAVDAVKAYIDSQKTDDDKAAEKDTEVREANRRAQIAEAKAEAMTMGVKPQYVDDLIILVLSKKSDDSELDLKTAIGEFKTKYPVWFGKSDDEDDDKGKTGKKGTGSSFKGKEKDKSKGTEKGLGARLAAQRRSSGSKKKSYWGNN